MAPIRTTSQPELLNHLANLPEIRPHIAAGTAPVDLSAFFNHPLNVMLGDWRGAALFFYAGNSRYRGHYLFTRHLRGREALLAAIEMLAVMFTTHFASAILGQVPRSNRASRAMTRALGFRPYGTSVDFDGHPCIDYTLGRGQWAVSLATFSEQTSRQAPTSRPRSKLSPASTT